MSNLRDVIKQFYLAHNEIFTGNVAPMEEVWSHSDDVTYMSPLGGILVGWEATRDSWSKQADLELHGHVDAIDMQVVEGESIGVCHNYIRGTNFVVVGKEVHPNIRATTVYRKESGAWKVISHHTDLMHWLEVEVG
ncbi:MAG: nuclear transport factor 2 family protein [Deltaproteobacteria bacterium]|nr:nuclear transport factor 2 family protein [Deltaproteobacteria bacterium]